MWCVKPEGCLQNTSTVSKQPTVVQRPLTAGKQGSTISALRPRHLEGRVQVWRRGAQGRYGVRQSGVSTEYRTRGYGAYGEFMLSV